jgi:hypothetical protein
LSFVTISKAATTAGVVSIALLAACTGEQPGPPPASSAAPQVSGRPSVAPDVAAASITVLDQYRRFRTAYNEAGATADYQDKDLISYLERPLKQKVIAFLLQMSQKKVVYRGTPESNPTVTNVNLQAKPPTVVVEDCFDATNYVLVYKRTGKPAPTGSTGPRRYILQTTATNFGADRGWLFTTSQGFPERTC